MKVWPWLLWGLFAGAWTAALIAPVPRTETLPIGELIAENRYLFAKSLHVGVYAVWTLISALLPMPPRWRVPLVAFLFAHGTLTELIQYATAEWTYRMGHIVDAAFDHLGVILGLAGGWKWWTRESR